MQLKEHFKVTQQLTAKAYMAYDDYQGHENYRKGIFLAKRIEESETNLKTHVPGKKGISLKLTIFAI